NTHLQRRIDIRALAIAVTHNELLSTSSTVANRHMHGFSFPLLPSFVTLSSLFKMILFSLILKH
ncbi:unnamed protein product, partial [Musa acuminata subsp. burmannicoides]